MFHLPIFPERSLAESVITTVWVGVAVISYFNLRLGWPFSGLVVPGYVVPLLIAKPISGAIVCLEGFLTYGIVYGLSERLRVGGSWSSLFGRDRFFGMVLVSLGVRLTLDGWLLPSFGEIFNQMTGLEFDYRNNLSGFGLIIVSLIANQFWKTGLVRGQAPFWTTMGITYIIVRFVLIEFTNFNVGNLEYMYESISTSLVSSPKSYIVLLTCAFIASRLNLLYGWDFNGILIPSLLALQWYNPQVIAITFIEAFVVYWLGDLALRLPIFANLTMEGARKMLLFFNVSFFYKFVLGHLQQVAFPTYDLTQFYGFGYLVSTLIALKIHDKHIPLRLSRATLQTSFAGAVVASSFGFILTSFPRWGEASVSDHDVVTWRAGDPEIALSDLLRQDKVDFYRSMRRNRWEVPLSHELDLFQQGLRQLDRYTRSEDPRDLIRGQRLLSRVRYSVQLVENRFLYLRETGLPRGWGVFVIDSRRRSGAAFEVPAPMDEWGVLECGAYLFRVFEGRALAIAGSSRRSSRDGSADVLKTGHTFFGAFHRIFGRHSVVQVRGYAHETLAAMALSLPYDSALLAARKGNVLWAQRSLPEELDVVALGDLVGSYHLEWGVTPFPNLPRDETRNSFCELALTRESRKRLLALSVLQSVVDSGAVALERADGYVAEALGRMAEEVAPRASEAYRSPQVEELLLFDDEILRPLLEIAYADPATLGDLDGSEHGGSLQVAASMAKALGYRVVLFRDRATATDCVLIQECAEPRRHWGTIALRLGDAAPYVIEVPRPESERHTLETGMALFQRLGARALIVAGAHPDADSDGSANILRATNKLSLFNLGHQALLRHPQPPELLAVQVRAFGVDEGEAPPDGDVFASFADGCLRPECFSTLGRELVRILASDGFDVALVEGKRETAGYEASDSQFATYSLYSPGHDFASLWFSPDSRSTFRPEGLDTLEAYQFDAAEVPSRVVDLYDHLSERSSHSATRRVPDELVRLVGEWADTRDVVTLAVIVDYITQQGGSRIERIIDVTTRRSYLSVSIEPDALPSLLTLAPIADQAAMTVDPSSLNRAALDTFQRSRARVLEITRLP